MPQDERAALSRRSDYDRPVSPETSAGIRSQAPAGAKKLRSRHVTMITLGGIIGASLFVGSGNIIHAAGPAARNPDTPCSTISRAGRSRIPT